MELVFKVASINQGTPHTSDPNELAITLYAKANAVRKGSLIVILKKNDPQLIKLFEAWRTDTYVHIDINL